jgi:hypothetical protein
MDPILLADEQTTLIAMVDEQRGEVAAILDDLTEEEAQARLVPSLTTPMGLVKHATFVEKVWFHSRIAGVDRRDLGLPDEVDDSFLIDPEDTVESVRAAYLEACARSREIAAGRDLEEEFPWREVRVSLRFIYAHMIRELARHAGHGDILVEQLKARR